LGVVERGGHVNLPKKSPIRKEDLAYEPLLLDLGQSEATMPDDLLHLVFSYRWVRRGHGNEENIGGLDRRGGPEFSRGGCKRREDRSKRWINCDTGKPLLHR
jgi:hypothetical protein